MPIRVKLTLQIFKKYNDKYINSIQINEIAKE